MRISNKKPKALFIDFDGTLIDSVPALFSAFSNFLRYHEKTATLEEFATMNGFTVQEMIGCIRAWHNITDPPEDLLVQYVSYIQRAYAEAKFFKGSFAFLEWAHREKIQLALVTAALREWVEPLLQREGFENFFKTLVTYNDIKKGKPSPEGFALAVQQLGVDPTEGYAIEDSPNGISAALEANIFVIQFRSNSHYVPHDERALFSGSWPEILHFIQGLR